MEKSLKINNLSSKIYLPESPVKEIVIGIHGFSGDKESSVLIELSKHLNKTGVALVTFDLPGHGENDHSTPLNLNKCIESIKSIFDFTKETFKRLPISAFATSFGGYLLLQHLSRQDEDLHKVILRAPAIFMADVLEFAILPFNNYSAEDLNKTIDLGFENQMLINKQFLDDLKYNNLEKTPKTKNFLYVIQGKKDNIVNYKMNETFFNDYYPNKHKIIYFENADHRFKKAGELERIIKETIEILN